ncbi:MAG: SpoIID/LytB domain-containing protein [Chitinispirillales bacterium]|jgi:stage II sporulation protein D|nr:SpoIID/LytB domain-containing protein [Chitinispirillales bacterium]
MKCKIFLFILLFLLSGGLTKTAVAARISRSADLKKVENVDADDTKNNVDEQSPTDTVSASDNTDDLMERNVILYPLADSVINSPRKVRVLLNKNIFSKNIFVYGKIKVSSQSVNINISQGSLRFSTIDENSVQISAHGRSAQVALPCTLSFVSVTNVFSYDAKEYRGNIIFTGGKNGISVINVINVEDYLRGVVPLEIGVRGEQEFEALKAQAIAARTYTLSKIIYGKDKEFDLLPTTADQVYGGVNCEYALSDKAIKETQGIVIVKDDAALLETYYHSTCAGKTSAIDEVWNSAPNASLISRTDLRPNGAPYCGNSNSYSWKETWTINQFSQILKKYSKLSNEKPFDGTVKSVFVVSRSESGRIYDLAVVSEKGTFHYGKDKIRFILRRPTKEEEILRSANFNIKMENNHIYAAGYGYGHGIGMCQTGAIERARAGQNYEEILRAYYNDIKFSTWDEVVISTCAF